MAPKIDTIDTLGRERGLPKRMYGVASRNDLCWFVVVVYNVRIGRNEKKKKIKLRAENGITTKKDDGSNAFLTGEQEGKNEVRWVNEDVNNQLRVSRRNWRDTANGNEKKGHERKKNLHTENHNKQKRRRKKKNPEITDNMASAEYVQAKQRETMICLFV